MTRKSLWLSLVVLMVIAIVTMAYLHTRSNRLDGWWLKQTGSGQLPEQMTVSVANGTFKMRYWDSGGVTTVTMPTDGRGYPLTAFSDPLSGVAISTTSWAEMKGNTLIVTKKLEHTAPKFHKEYAWTEAWSVKPDGRLVISTPSEADVIYLRAPLWARLWKAAP